MTVNIGKRGLYGLLLLPQNRPQYMIAKRLNVWPERMSDYSHGRLLIPDRVLIRMCRVLEVVEDGVTRYATADEILCDYELLSV